MTWGAIAPAALLFGYEQLDAIEADEPELLLSVHYTTSVEDVIRWLQAAIPDVTFNKMTWDMAIRPIDPNDAEASFPLEDNRPVFRRLRALLRAVRSPLLLDEDVMQAVNAFDSIPSEVFSRCIRCHHPPRQCGPPYRATFDCPLDRLGRCDSTGSDDVVTFESRTGCQLDLAESLSCMPQ